LVEHPIPNRLVGGFKSTLGRNGETMASQDYDPDWYEKARRERARPDPFLNTCLGVWPKETDEQQAAREKWCQEHPTDPRNYRGVNWSEVG
jgi:hypothetical protein